MNLKSTETKSIFVESKIDGSVFEFKDPANKPQSGVLIIKSPDDLDLLEVGDRYDAFFPYDNKTYWKQVSGEKLASLMPAH